MLVARQVLIVNLRLPCQVTIGASERGHHSAQ
jgi:hypothetical protein